MDHSSFTDEGGQGQGCKAGGDCMTNSNKDDAGSVLQFQKVKVAEDEISILWKETARIENSEQAAEAARQSQLDNFWPQIEAMADRCDEILLKHGFPRAAQMVRHDGAGKWWPHPPDSPKAPPAGETWKFTRGSALAQEFAPDFSDAWYAGRIGFQCRLALEHFREGDAGEPFLFSKVFVIATLRNDWQWRSGHKPSILTGRGVRKGGKLGGEMRSKNYAQDTEIRIAEMRRLIGEGHSQSSAADALARRGIGKSRDANLKLWQRHANKT